MNTNHFNSRISFFKAIMAVLLMAFCMTTYATDQESDIFLDNGKKYDLYVNWGHPSPLQVLYIRTDTESPFRSYSTGNYRGHVATWQVCDSALYLVSVDSRYHIGGAGTYWPNDSTRIDTMAEPAFFGIQSLSGVARGKMARYSRIGFREFWKLPRRIRMLKAVHLKNGSVISISVMVKC